MQKTSKISKPECVYCNNAPVNHKLEYFLATTSIMNDYLLPGNNSKPPPQSFVYTAKGITSILNKLLQIFRILRYTSTSDKLATSRTKAVWNEAVSRGIKIEQLSVFGRPLEMCRMYLQPKNYKKPKWFYFESLPVPPWCDIPEYSWIDDKREYNKKFTQSDLPVAKSLEVTTIKSLYKAVDQIGFPLIIKPRAGSRARHTTVNITNIDDLKSAYKRAKQLCYFILAEEFIPGYVYRATCIGKKVVGILKFIRPNIIADGTMNIEELLNYHNTHKKFDNLTDVKINEWLIDSLYHQGYSLKSIPDSDREIVFTEHSERPNGGYFIDVTEYIPQENIALIERAANVAQLDVIGFDIISRDLTKSYQEEKLTFIEGNSLPFIELHLEVYEGKIYDTPKALFDLWF